MALELVSGADFWCKLMSGGRPVDLGGGPGVDFRAKTPENRPENFDFYPLFTLPFLGRAHILKAQVYDTLAPTGLGCQSLGLVERSGAFKRTPGSFKRIPGSF